jgi:NADH-quinone oxidoreductase subunit M
MNAALLPLLLAVPLAGSLALLVLPAALADRIAVRLGVLASGLTVVLACWSAASEPTTNVSWVPSLGLRFHLGIDGISSPLVLLTAGLTFLCTVYSLKVLPETGRPRGLIGLVLLL